MPTTRTRRPHHRDVLTLDSFTLPELLSFSAAWRPPGPRGVLAGRWQTWGEFLEDWQLVRELFYADDWGSHLAPSGAFADRILAEYGPSGPPASDG